MDCRRQELKFGHMTGSYQGIQVRDKGGLDLTGSPENGKKGSGLGYVLW